LNPVDHAHPADARVAEAVHEGDHSEENQEHEDTYAPSFHAILRGKVISEAYTLRFFARYAG
jgi:hypothetical protein